METYRELLPKLHKKEIKYSKDVYAKIAEVCVSQGYDVTALQCENRVKHLNRTYKDFNWVQNQTGEGTCFFECEDICHDLWAKKHNVKSPVTLSSVNGIKIKESSESNTKDADLTNFSNDANDTNGSVVEDLASELIRNDEEREKAIETAITDQPSVPCKKMKKTRTRTSVKTNEQLEACLTKINTVIASMQERKIEREAVNQQIMACCKADDKLKNLQYTISMNQLQSSSTL